MLEEEITLNGRRYKLVKEDVFHECVIDLPPYRGGCKSAAALIKGSIVWGRTDEGFGYWQRVYNNLLKYASSVER